MISLHLPMWQNVLNPIFILMVHSIAVCIDLKLLTCVEGVAVLFLWPCYGLQLLLPCFAMFKAAP